MQGADVSSLLQTITSFGVVVWEKLPVAGFAVLFSNATARQILGESLREAPRPEVARVFDQALSAPNTEVRMDVMGGLGREPFLARVFGLPGPGRLVVVHVHTPDFPLVQVVKAGAAAAAAAAGNGGGPATSSAVAAAASAMDAYRASRAQSTAEAQSEMALLQSMQSGAGRSIDFSPAGLGLHGASFDFLLYGSRGSFGTDEIPLPCFEWTAAGECVMANRAMREVLGCPPGAPVAALGVAGVVAPASRAAVLQMLAEVLGPGSSGNGNGGGPAESARSGSVTLRRLDGTEFAARVVLARPAEGTCAAGQVLANV